VVSVSVNLNATPAMLNSLRSIVTNQRTYGLFRSMANLLFTTWWAETFRKQGARRGHTAWVPLKPAYQRWKVAHKRSPKIMQYYGHLQRSVQILEETATTLVWGTKIPYSEYHQAPTVKGRPPKRELVFITDSDVREMERFIVKFSEAILNVQKERHSNTPLNWGPYRRDNKSEK